MCPHKHCTGSKRACFLRVRFAIAKHSFLIEEKGIPESEKYPLNFVGYRNVVSNGQVILLYVVTSFVFYLNNFLLFPSFVCFFNFSFFLLPHLIFSLLPSFFAFFISPYFFHSSFLHLFIFFTILFSCIVALFWALTFVLLFSSFFPSFFLTFLLSLFFFHSSFLYSFLTYFPPFYPYFSFHLFVVFSVFFSKILNLLLLRRIYSRFLRMVPQKMNRCLPNKVQIHRRRKYILY